MTINPGTGLPVKSPGLPKLNVKQSTMAATVSDALRALITAGELAPGARISEEWVSGEMGVSRGPVRESLRSLENEGLLIVHPYRGAVVTAMTTDELRNVLIPVRVILETEACRQSLHLLNKDDFDVLDRIVNDMRKLAESPDEDSTNQLVDLDVQFHDYLTSKGGQYHTLQLWRTIQPRIRAGFVRLTPRHPDLTTVAEEHAELVAALRSRDLDRALATLESHIRTQQIALLDRQMSQDVT